MGKLALTIVSVVAAVGAFTALWIGVNQLFDQASKSWSRFSVLVGAAIGFIVFGIIHGNRLLTTIPGMESARESLTWGSERDPTTFVGDIVALLWWAIPGALIFALIGFLLSIAADPIQRLTISIVSGLGVGVILGLTLKSRYLPGLKLLPMLIWPIAAAAIGFGIAALRKRSNPPRWALAFATIGWLCGTVGVSRLGIGTRPEAIMVFVVAGLLAGGAIGLGSLPDQNRRTFLDQKSRAWIFIAPAVVFISATLVIPAIITLLLSFRDADGEANVWLNNYRGVFRGEDLEGNAIWNESNFDLAGWSAIFTSRLFVIGIVFFAIAAVLTFLQGRRTRRFAELNPQTGGFAAAAVVLIAFAVFAALRGTIINNLWWVFTVTAFATGMGLTIAAWSDGRRGERFAKSVIFMPMAISFVGAAIIWRFMYRPQDISKNQTGFLNAAWVWLGSKTAGAAPTSGDSPDYDPERYSNLGIGLFDYELFNFNAKPLFVIGFVAATLFLAYRAVRSFSQHQEAGLVGWGLPAIAFGYLAYRTAVEGIGGYLIQEGGNVVPQVILFREQGPFNNFWLMVVLLWIETGFAMVILSAAIKAVPSEFIEAAKIDGADDTQVFWRITVPQIAPTIGVVVTTIIVRVTKVYDIVNVMTGGNFDTNVLANEMIDQAFQFGDSGEGSALAILLFLSVLPIMYMNIRRMQKGAAV